MGSNPRRKTPRSPRSRAWDRSGGMAPVSPRCASRCLLSRVALDGSLLVRSAYITVTHLICGCAGEATAPGRQFP